jgi:hypothetical protein
MVNVSYNRACLNCLTGSGYRHISMFAENEFEFDSHKATWEFRALWKIKKTLYDSKINCDYCNHIGCYDVWDLEIDDKKIYLNPDSGQPWTKFFIDKKNKEIEITAKSIELGSNITIVTFFDLIIQVVTNMPDFAFIAHNNGFFVASVFYIPEYDNATFNLLRHSGLKKEEILISINKYREIFKRNAGFYR